MKVKVYLHRDYDIEGLMDETGLARDSEEFDNLWGFLYEVELKLEWDPKKKKWIPIGIRSTNF